MFEISKINSSAISDRSKAKANNKHLLNYNNAVSSPQIYSKYSAENLKAYIPSFTRKKSKNNIPSKQAQFKAIKALLDKNDIMLLNKLDKIGVLDNNSSNDGSTVIDNLYKIATEPRIVGISSKQIIKDVINALSNPYSITQKFGDIPQEVAEEYRQKMGNNLPEQAYNVASSSCVVASIEFNLAQKKPAEFARFANGLSSENYSIDKKIKLSNFAGGSTPTALWELREFNTDSQIYSNWEDINIRIRPDRNAIVRARVQSSYKDKGERSVVDVLVQSALLNLGSQHTYDALVDEREEGNFNNERTGLSEVEKNFVEEVVFENPKISVVYQNIDENGYLIGYHGKIEETKDHILKSLALGQNVIVGYTHIDENNKIDGGHEITIIGYQQDKHGKGYFICNDTDDNIDAPITISEDKLLPLIHHAGISKEALSENDYFAEEPWRELIKNLKQ